MASRPASPTAETATFEKLLHFGQKRRYYTPAEVSMHNSKEDCWVSIHGKVFDLAQLLAANKPELGRALVLHAGKDISRCVWFAPDRAEGCRCYTYLLVPPAARPPHPAFAPRHCASPALSRGPNRRALSRPQLVRGGDA